MFYFQSSACFLHICREFICSSTRFAVHSTLSGFMSCRNTYQLEPGPLDRSVLTGQLTHRSRDIWNGSTSGYLIVEMGPLQGCTMRSYTEHQLEDVNDNGVENNDLEDVNDDGDGNNDFEDDNNVDGNNEGDITQVNERPKRIKIPKRCGTGSHYLYQHGRSKKN